MNQVNDGDKELQEQIRTVQVFYHTKYPTATMNIRYESIKALIEFCNADIKYIESAIMSLNDKTSKGEVPGFDYVAKVVKDKFKKKVDPKPSYTEQELMDMCLFSIRDKMLIDLSGSRPTDYIPEDELPITGFNDPNLRKMIQGWYEDGKIDKYLYDHAINGITILNEGLLGNFKNIAEQIADMAEVPF